MIMRSTFLIAILLNLINYHFGKPKKLEIFGNSFQTQQLNRNSSLILGRLLTKPIHNGQVGCKKTLSLRPSIQMLKNKNSVNWQDPRSLSMKNINPLLDQKGYFSSQMITLENSMPGIKEAKINQELTVLPMIQINGTSFPFALVFSRLKMHSLKGLKKKTHFLAED